MGKSPSDIKQNIKDTKAKIEDTVGTINDQIADTAETTKGKLSDAADGVRNQLSNVAGVAGDGLQKAQDSVRNPLPILIGSAIVGFAAGLIAPLTMIEKERLQPVGDEIARRAYAARDEVVSESRAVVIDTVVAARDSAQTHAKNVADHLGIETPEKTA